VAAYEPWSQERAAGIIAGLADQEGAALPILHQLQKVFGYITTDAVPMIAEALNLTRAEVHGIVTFYHDFRRHPPGRHVLQVCRAEACQALGADSLARHVRESTGLDWHETALDGSVTLQPVFCLGLCAIGPAAMLDGQPLARLDPVKMTTVLRTAV
jgi:formate dehydrogenase subunit gamma